MAARELVEDEHVLSLEKIKKLFNPFLKKQYKLLNKDSIDSWIAHPHSKQRLFGVTPSKYRAMNRPDHRKAKEAAIVKFQDRFAEIFQRRHYCIHNCDRPKMAPASIKTIHVKKLVYDIEFLVSRCSERLREDYPLYLRSKGFSAAVCNTVTGWLKTRIRERLKALQRENRELKRANEALRKAAAYFAQAELDRRHR